MTIPQLSCRLWLDTAFDGSYDQQIGDELISANGQMRIASPSDTISSPRGIVNQCTFKVSNNRGLLGLADYEYYQCPVYFEVSATGSLGTHYRQFTGVIETPSQDTPTTKAPGSISFDARGRENEILQKRISTDGGVFAAYHAQGKTESQIIARWLFDAGVSGSEYVLDNGLFIIPWAWLDDESPLEDIWQLASACGGWFYSDQNGILRYENMAHWVNNATVVATYTPDDYQSLKIRHDTKDLYGKITCEVSSRDIEGSDTVWTSNEQVSVPASGTKQVVASLQQPLYELSAVEYTATTFGGLNMDASISVIATHYAQRVILDFTNAHATKSANLAGLKITGRTVHGGPSNEVSAESSALYWTHRQQRVRRLPRNNYIQSAAQAQALCDFLRDRGQSPRRSFIISRAVGNPTLSLGNRIRISGDPDLASATDAYIIAINWEYSKNGFVQTIECIEASGIYPYAGASPGYFYIGTNKLGTSSAQRGRLFY